MISRRLFLTASAGALLTGAAIAGPMGVLLATDLGLVPDSDADQSVAFQAAVDRAARENLALQLPRGTLRVADIRLPDNAVITGEPGPAILQLTRGENILYALKAQSVRLYGVGLVGNGGKNPDDATGLFYGEACSDLRIDACTISNAATQGIYLEGCNGRIIGNRISAVYGAGISSRNGDQVWIGRNRISDCGNLGIYIERGEPGFDGTIITENRIARIDWKEGGDGQNGNGINAYRADNVVISDNVISECAFSAVRLNGTRDCQITGNNCTNLSEVAIFSEFDFSGSIINNNIIDQAAQGIAITNFNDGGRLAVCANNIVRNIWTGSPTNPETTPVGIGIEADTVVTGNVVENVPGTGIALGWGPYMRDLDITGNVLRNCNVGIGVSVVDGVGNAVISGNLVQVSGKQLAFAGTEWDSIVQPDLLSFASRYPLLTFTGNHISR